MRGPAYLTTLLLACALTLPLMNTGCAEHRYARVYDPYRHDHHRWSPDEDAHYRHWESENHKEHREWAQRNSEEQKEYWSWRHGHGDHDHDKH
jgi:hypothetical protein